MIEKTPTLDHSQLQLLHCEARPHCNASCRSAKVLKIALVKCRAPADLRAMALEVIARRASALPGLLEDLQSELPLWLAGSNHELQASTLRLVVPLLAAEASTSRAGVAFLGTPKAGAAAVASNLAVILPTPKVCAVTRSLLSPGMAQYLGRVEGGSDQEAGQ